MIAYFIVDNIKESKKAVDIFEEYGVGELDKDFKIMPTRNVDDDDPYFMRRYIPQYILFRNRSKMEHAMLVYKMFRSEKG